MQAIYPTSKFKAVTASDTVMQVYANASVTGDPGAPCILTRFKALYVGGAGDVAVKNDAGTSVIFQNVPAGTLLPISGTYVMATGTSATNIVALYD